MEEVKISLFADDMIVYLSDPKNSTRELLQLINIFSKVAVYKSNSNKSVAFLYSKHKQVEKEIRESSPFTIATIYKVPWYDPNQASEGSIQQELQASKE